MLVFFFKKDTEEECFECKYYYYSNRNHYFTYKFKTRDYTDRNDPLRTYRLRFNFIDNHPDIEYSRKKDCK